MREVDPWVLLSRHHFQLERLSKLVLNVLSELRRLKESGVLDPREYIAIREVLKEKQNRLNLVSDEEVLRMLREYDHKPR